MVVPHGRVLRKGVRRHSIWWIAAVLITGIGVAAGCAAVRVPQQPVEPTPTNPVWSDDELRDHIEFLNGEDLMGRATGTQGYARAAAYVAARMLEFRLQPAVEGEYRMIYGVSLNFPVAATIRSVGVRDSLTYLPGVDFLPDARSDSGTVRLSRVVFADGPPPVGASFAAPFAVVMRGASTPVLQAWADAGARFAVVITGLEPRFQPTPVRGLLIAQMTEVAAARIMNVQPAELVDLLETARDESRRLSRVLAVRIATDHQPQAGAINMLGYYAGKHPKRQGELVILCADLDAVGHFAGVPAIDFANFGIAAAAVLEVTRNLGFVTHRWPVPERSVMVAVWSGSQTGHSGLRYFLKNPTWALGRVVSVVYVGLSPSEEMDVRRILADYDIPLTSVPASGTPLYEPSLVLRPTASVLRMARDRDGVAPDLAMPDPSALVDTAVVRAHLMADRAYDVTLLQATDSASFFPAREDTLPIPPAADIR